MIYQTQRSYKLVKHNPKVCKHEDWEHAGPIPGLAGGEKKCLGKNGRLNCACPGYWKEIN